MCVINTYVIVIFIPRPLTLNFVSPLKSTHGNRDHSSSPYFSELLFCIFSEYAAFVVSYVWSYKCMIGKICMLLAYCFVEALACAYFAYRLSVRCLSIAIIYVL